MTSCQVKVIYRLAIYLKIHLCFLSLISTGLADLIRSQSVYGWPSFHIISDSSCSDVPVTVDSSTSLILSMEDILIHAGKVCARNSKLHLHLKLFLSFHCGFSMTVKLDMVFLLLCSLCKTSS